RHVERSGEVDLQGTFPIPRAEFEAWRNHRDTGVVDQDVDSSELPDRGIDEPIAIRRGGHVAGSSGDRLLTPLLTQLSHNRGDIRRVSGVHDNLCPMAQE